MKTDDGIELDVVDGLICDLPEGEVNEVVQRRPFRIWLQKAAEAEVPKELLVDAFMVEVPTYHAVNDLRVPVGVEVPHLQQVGPVHHDLCMLANKDYAVCVRP